MRCLRQIRSIMRSFLDAMFIFWLISYHLVQEMTEIPHFQDLTLISSSEIYEKSYIFVMWRREKYHWHGNIIWSEGLSVPKSIFWQLWRLKTASSIVNCCFLQRKSKLTLLRSRQSSWPSGCLQCVPGFPSNVGSSRLATVSMRRGRSSPRWERGGLSPETWGSVLSAVWALMSLDVCFVGRSSCGRARRGGDSWPQLRAEKWYIW